MLAVAVLGIILELRATELSRALFSWRGCGQRAHYFARMWAARTLFRAKVGCALVLRAELQVRKCSARCYFSRSSSVRERQRADAKVRTSAVRGRARGFGGKPSVQLARYIASNSCTMEYLNLIVDTEIVRLSDRARAMRSASEIGSEPVAIVME